MLRRLMNKMGLTASAPAMLGVSTNHATEFNSALVSLGFPRAPALRAYKDTATMDHWGDVANWLQSGYTVWVSTTRTDSTFFSGFKSKFGSNGLNAGRNGSNKLKLIYWHEPENDANMSPSLFTTNFRKVSSALKSDFEMAVTMMAYTYRDKGRTAWLSTGWPGASYVDYLTVDGYQKTFPYATWSKILDPARDFAASKGVKFGIMEWGCRVGGPQATGVSDMGTYLFAHPEIKVAIYWDSAATYDYTLHNNATAMKAYGALL